MSRTKQIYLAPTPVTAQTHLNTLPAKLVVYMTQLKRWYAIIRFLMNLVNERTTLWSLQVGRAIRLRFLAGQIENYISK